MKSSLYEERYLRLHDSISDALRKMKNDGLAMQLEKHYLSVDFAEKRLAEVLANSIDSDREKFITSLSNDYDELLSLQDRIILKQEASKKKFVDKVNSTHAENSELKSIVIINEEKLQKLKVECIRSEEKLLTRMKTVEEQIKDRKALSQKTKIVLASLNSDLQNIKTQINEFMGGIRIVKQQQKSSISNHSRSPISKANLTKAEIFKSEYRQKVAMIEDIQKRKKEVTRSLISLQSIVKDLAQENGMKEDVTIGNIQSVLKQTIKKIEDEHVEEHLRQATSQLDGVKITRDTYAEAVDSLYHRLLLERENHYNEIIRELNRRSSLLKAQIKDAIAQLKALKGTDSDDITINFSYETFQEK